MATPLRRIPKTGAAMSLATRELIQYLETMQPNDFVTYADLKTLTGVDHQERLLDLLGTARHYLRETYRKEFDLLPGQGVLCLTEAGKVGVMRRRRRELHTRATKSVRIGQTVDLGQLTDSQKYLHLAELSVVGAVSLATHEQTVEELETTHAPRTLLMDPAALKRDLFKGL
jgi:hypothetical protein